MTDEIQPYEPKRPRAWTAYKFWEDTYKRVQAWSNRKNRVEAGKSKMDLALILSAHSAFEAMLEDAAKPELVQAGREFGAVYEWATSIKGIGDWLAVKVLAPIDDIERFSTISKLWRFCGLACIDGEAEPRDSEHYVRKLKATLLGEQGVADQFNRHKPFPYRDIYLEYKARKREEHPEPVCTECGALSPEKNSNGKSKCCKAKVNYTDAHLDNMALRKSAKEFIKHLWLVWRQSEGLPITEPHNQDDVIPPPNWPLGAA
jgi:hypothetical protein